MGHDRLIITYQQDSESYHVYLQVVKTECIVLLKEKSEAMFQLGGEMVVVHHGKWRVWSERGGEWRQIEGEAEVQHTCLLPGGLLLLSHND